MASGIPRPFVTNTEWSSGNTTRTDELWTKLPAHVGMVAVDMKFSQDMGFYATEPFPWDQKKGVYMLEGYHSLHCLVQSSILLLTRSDWQADGDYQMYIYRALREFEQGLPQTTPMRHHIHCLDALRENALCSADDTLRPAGTGVAKPQDPRNPPRKQCRDRAQLERWALQNSACFKRFPDNDSARKTLKEWTWCPDQSMYSENIKAIFAGSQLLDQFRV